MTLHVRNWEEFQHYKHRQPPWIKLHFALLTSEDWVMWNDASRVLAVACMLLASRSKGEVPSNPAYIQRVAYLNDTPDLAPLISCGFLVSDDPLADASTLQADASLEKSRERVDKEKRESRSARAKFKPPTVGEVREYTTSKNYTFDPEAFVAYYAAAGWKLASGNPMKDWHAACTTWQKREKPRAGSQRAGAASDDNPWHPDDVEASSGHESWDEYMDYCLALPADKWPAKRFNEWLLRG